MVLVLTLPDGSVAGGFWSEGLPAGAPWALEGAGGVAMSVRQLHDWTVALVSGEIIDEGSVDLMVEPQVETALVSGEPVPPPVASVTGDPADLGGVGGVEYEATAARA